MPAISRVDSGRAAAARDEEPLWQRGATLRLSIATAQDVVMARRGARELGARLGFGCVGRAVLSAIISELARTFIAGPTHAELVIRSVESAERRGLQIEAGGSALGPSVGSPGSTELVRLNQSLIVVRRLADEFEMTSRAGGGTLVRATKWIS